MKTKLELYKQYLSNIHRSQVYYNFLRPMAVYLEKENLNFDTLTKDDFTKYFTIKKYSLNSINNLIKACRDFCKYQNTTKHVCFEVKLLEVEHRQRQYMYEDDLQKAIKYLATYNSRIDMQKVEVILYFLLYTGCRKSEILNLKRSKFNFEDNSVLIYEEKLNKEKIIPFPANFADKIKTFFTNKEEKENAFNITLAEINYLFRVISKRLGKHLSPHMLRHGSAKWMLSKGIPLTCLQKILGHTSINTTMIYAESDQKDIERNYREKIG